jgi:ABC transporter substrate binding protein
MFSDRDASSASLNSSSGRPNFTPRAFARVRPSPVRAMISSRSNSASDEVPTAFVTMARERVGAVMVMSDALTVMQRDLARSTRDLLNVLDVHRELIATLAARHRLPAVYSDRGSIIAGGLIAYGPDRIDQYRRAAGYVDRILKGEKPADLPVQAPMRCRGGTNCRNQSAPRHERPYGRRAAEQRDELAPFLACGGSACSCIVYCRASPHDPFGEAADVGGRGPADVDPPRPMPRLHSVLGARDSALPSPVSSRA